MARFGLQLVEARVFPRKALTGSQTKIWLALLGQSLIAEGNNQYGRLLFLNCTVRLAKMVHLRLGRGLICGLKNCSDKKSAFAIVELIWAFEM